MHTKTRLRILDYLRRQQTASVMELSRALAKTGANIRYHLAELESNGLVETISQRQEERGRPVSIYGLSRWLQGNGLEELVKATLIVWQKKSSESTLDADLKDLALQLGGEPPKKHETLLPYRLGKLIDRLNELHYRARWEAGANGPHIILGYCPYAAIINTNPELCRMDAFLVEKWTGLRVNQTTRLQTGVKGYPTCAFQVAGL